jgi:hypothetical protein
VRGKRPEQPYTPLTYAQARARGSYFYTGCACKSCGGTKRYVSGWRCVACAIERAQAYGRRRRHAPYKEAHL